MKSMHLTLPIVVTLSLLAGSAQAQDTGDGSFYVDPVDDTGTFDGGGDGPAGPEDDPTVAFPSAASLVSGVADAAAAGALQEEGPHTFLLPLVVAIQQGMTPQEVAYLTQLRWTDHDSLTLARDPVVRAMVDRFRAITAEDGAQNDGQASVVGIVQQPEFIGALGFFLTTVAPDVERGTLVPAGCTVTWDGEEASCAFVTVASTMVAAALDAMQDPGPGGNPYVGTYADPQLAIEVGLPDFDPEADDGSGDDGGGDFDPHNVQPMMLPSGQELIAFVADAVEDGTLPDHPVLGFLRPVSASVRENLPDVYVAYLSQVWYQDADAASLAADPAIHALAEAFRVMGGAAHQNEGQAALMARVDDPAFPTMIAQLIASSSLDVDRGVHSNPGCSFEQDQRTVTCGFAEVVAAALGAAVDMMDLDVLPPPIPMGEHADPGLAYEVGAIGEEPQEGGDDFDAWILAASVIEAAIDGTLPHREELAFLAFPTAMAQAGMGAGEVGYLRDLAWSTVNPEAVAADPAVDALIAALAALAVGALPDSGVAEAVAGVTAPGYRSLLGMALTMQGAALEAASASDCSIEVQPGVVVTCGDVARVTVALAASAMVGTMNQLPADPAVEVYADPTLAVAWSL